MSDNESGWQPIETAPNMSQENKILVFCRGKVDIQFADGDWWRREKINENKAIPTHWMPLPEPPEEPLA